MADIASHQSLQELSWPVVEFSTNIYGVNVGVDWNSERSLEVLRDVIMSVRLPNIADSCEMQLTSNWSPKVASDIWLYISQVIESHSGKWMSGDSVGGKTRLYSRVRQLLDKAENRFNNYMVAMATGGLCQPRDFLPWTDIIYACIEYQLGQLHCCELMSLSRSTSTSTDAPQLMVHVMPDLLHQFTPLRIAFPSYTPCCSDTIMKSVKTPRNAQKRKQETPVTSVVKLPRSMALDMSSDAGSLHYNVVDSPPAVGIIHCTKSQKKAKAATERLKLALQHEQEESSAFESFLRNAVAGGDEQIGSVRIDTELVTPVCATRSLSHRLARSLPPVPLSLRCRADAVTSTPSPPSVEISLVDRSKSLSDKLNELNDALLTEKEADKLFEMQLLQICLFE
jgi:hypothetical protein